MRDVSILTMQRYLRRYRGRGVFLSRWHKDMQCYIVNENLADHAKPTIESPKARVACVPAIDKSRWIRSRDGHVYSKIESLWLQIKVLWRFKYRMGR